MDIKYPWLIMLIVIEVNKQSYNRTTELLQLIIQLFTTLRFVFVYQMKTNIYLGNVV